MLQTENYTHALLRQWVNKFALPSAEVDRRVEARRVRQNVLTRDPPVHLSAVIDESVLHRKIGESAVMREQLEHLAALSEQPNIDIGILPFRGEHLVGTGAFNYLRFHPIHSVSLNDYVVFEHLAGMDEVEDESEVNQYKVAFESLMNDALRSGEARTLIDVVVNRMWILTSGCTF